MVEERLNRIEDMLTTLIKMNGTQNEKLSSLSQDQAVMKEGMSDLKEEMFDLKEEMFSLKGKMSGLKEEMSGLKGEMSVLKEEMFDLNEEMSSMKDGNSKRHAEILNKLADMQADQDYIWKKAASNERDLDKLKTRLGL